MVTRRRSLGTLAASAASATGAVAFTGCGTPGRALIAQSRVRLAEDIVSAYENWYASTCRGCSAGCGIIVRVIEGRAKKIEGNPDHPLNEGKLCARGQAGVQEEYHPDRIGGPLRLAGERGSGTFAGTTWEAALDQLTSRLRQAIESGRGDRVVLITPPLRATRALIVDRFIRALGAQWLIFDPLPEAPLREAARRLFGADRLPWFDLQRAQYVLSFGADFLSTWLSPVRYAIDYGIFRQGSYRAATFLPRRDRPRGYLVQVEPRFSATAASADEWVPVTPGAEGMLALSLAQVILGEGLADPAGAAAFGDPAALDPYRPERIAPDAGVDAGRIRALARAFAQQRPSLALGGGAAGAHTNGTDALTAILALNVLTGAVNAPGGVRASPPPPLPAAGQLEPAPLAAWQQLVARLAAQQVDTVLVYGADPVHSLPKWVGLREALLRAPFIASFSSFIDDTTALADLLLPSHLPLEDWGDDVPEPGGGVPIVTVQQPVVRPFFDTRSFWDVLLAVAGALGGPVAAALPWASVKEALRASVQVLHAAGRGSVQEAQFEAFWTRLLQQGGWWDSSAPAAGALSIMTPVIRQVISGLRPARFAGDGQDTFFLVVFPHHTLGAGETAHLPWLQATPDPVTTVVWQTWVEISPEVARRRGLREGDVVRLESPQGRLEAPLYLNPALPPSIVAVPMGQGHRRYGRWAERRGANPLDLLAPLVDEATGVLAGGATRVRLINTGRRVVLPKLEGTVPARQLPDRPVIRVTRGTRVVG